MQFFTDTNIPIAYTVIHDKWHENAIKFFKKHEKDNIFWSNLVKKEYDEKLGDIIDEVTNFLETSEDLLNINNKDFINYYDFEKYLLKRTGECNLDRTKKQKILEHFWEKYGFSEGISGIISSKFSVFINYFELIYYTRESRLENILILHDCGLNNYLKYLDYAKKLYKWGVHKPDCKIVIDAHDCGKRHGDLIFVSADKKMIEKILNHNTNFLSITEFKSYN